MKKTINNFQRNDFCILFIVLIIALIFRLYKINIPLADYHSWRQADTAAVARNFVKNGFDLLHPRYDDLSSIQSGLENLQGYRMVEFPIYNAIFAFLYKLWPIVSLEVYGRLTSAIFSLTTIAIIYYLTLKEADRTAAFFASLVYAIFPFFVFFSRTIFPETTALSFCFLAIFFLYLFANNPAGIKKNIFYVLSLVLFATSLLIKPTVIFYALVLFYLFIRTYQKLVFKKISVYIYFFVSLFPFFLWRYYIKSYPEGIPPNDWLLTSVNTYQGLKNILFRPAFFRWIFFERINIAIFGGYLTFFFLLGVLAKSRKYLLHLILISALTYLFVFQGGNVQHEYYQIIIFPALAIFVGLGVSFIYKNSRLFLYPVVSSLILIAVFGLSFFFAYYKVKDYYNYPAELPQIAKIVTTLTKEDDKIVTDRLGDTTLLYLINRRGAPAVYKDPEELKKLNYSYLVTLNKDTIDNLKLKNNLQVVFENDKFALFKL